MAALLVPEPLLDLPAAAEVWCEAGAVTTTVCPPIVTTDGEADVVAEVFGWLIADEDVDEDDVLDGSEGGTTSVVPER